MTRKRRPGWWAHQDLNLEPTDYESVGQFASDRWPTPKSIQRNHIFCHAETVSDPKCDPIARQQKSFPQGPQKTTGARFRAPGRTLWGGLRAGASSDQTLSAHSRIDAPLTLT